MRVFRDEVVGRIAYDLAQSTGGFVVLFGYTTCGCRTIRNPDRRAVREPPLHHVITQRAEIVLFVCAKAAMTEA
jgi:hypothetical protein